MEVRAAHHPTAGGLDRGDPLARQLRRDADVEVDPVAQRPLDVHVLEPDRRVAAHRVDEVVVADLVVGQRGAPEAHHRLLLRGVDGQLHRLQHRRVGGEAELPGRRRDGSRQRHVLVGQAGHVGRPGPHVDTGRPQVDVRYVSGGLTDRDGTPHELGAGGVRRGGEPGAGAERQHPPVLHAARSLELQGGQASAVVHPPMMPRTASARGARRVPYAATACSGRVRPRSWRCASALATRALAMAR